MLAKKDLFTPLGSLDLDQYCMVKKTDNGTICSVSYVFFVYIMNIFWRQG